MKKRTMILAVLSCLSLNNVAAAPAVEPLSVFAAAPTAAPLSVFAAAPDALRIMVAGDPKTIGPHEHRIVTEVYSTEKVYPIYTKIGRATLIQFEKGETLDQSASSLLAMGDSKAWDVGVKGNNITIKPKSNLPNTNAIVVTNKRTYVFDLINKNKTNHPTYIIKFVYPKTLAEQQKTPEQLKEEAEIARIKELTKDRTPILNTNYVRRGGNALLAPTKAWDDGQFTYLVYDHAGDLPVFYKVLPDNTEALANYSIDDKDKSIVTIHEVVRTAKARLNDEVVEIVNKSYKAPQVNYKGTTNNKYRLEK